jgi:hypothetical protein
MSSCPCSAGPLLPDTGASTNSRSGWISASRAPVCSVASTPIVPICAHTAPGANASATWSPNITDSTTAAVGSVVIATLASRTASAGDPAARAPSRASPAAQERLVPRQIR